MSVNIGTATGYIDLDTTRFVASLRGAQTELAGAGSRMTSTERAFSSASKSMVSAGKGLTKYVTLPIVGIGTGIVKTSAKFESGMSKVSAISGATGSDLEKLSNKAKEMGAKTKFSASESADAFSYMAMAGWKTADMLDGIEGVMALAAASGEDLAQTSDIVTDSLTAFGMKAKDTQHFVDVLARASTNSNTNVSLMGETFKYVAPVAGALGYSVDDVAVAIGLMANQGIKASQAGTALRSLFTNLAKPSKEMKTAMNDLGISMTDAQGKMKPFNQLMMEMRQSFSGLTKQQKAQYAATLAGKTGMSGLLAIVNSSDEDFAQLTESIANCNGASQEMAATMNDNLSGQWTILKSTIEGIALQFGESLLPVLKRIVEAMQDFANKVTKMSDSQRRFILIAGALAAALGPLLMLLGNLTGAGLKIGFAIKNASEIAKGFQLIMGAMTGPVGIAIGAIAGLILIFTHLYKTNENVKKAFDNAWKGIQNSVSSAMSRIKPALDHLMQAFGKLFKAIEPLLVLFGVGLVASIMKFIGTLNGILHAIGPIIDAIANLIDFVAELILAFKDLFTGNFEGAGEHFSKAFDSLKEAVKNVFEGIKEYIVNFWQGMFGVLQTAGEMLGLNIKEAFMNFINAIAEFFQQLPGKVQGWLTNVITNVINWGVQMQNKAREVGINFVNGVIDFFQQLPYRIGFLLGFVITKTIQWTVAMVAKAKETGSKFVQSVMSFFQQLPGKTWTWFTNTISKAIQWGSQMQEKGRTGAQNTVNAIITFFQQLPSKVWNWFIQTINKAIQWGAQMQTKGREGAKKFSDAVVNGMKSLPSKMSSIGRNIVQGIWNGISGAAGWLTSKVNSFAKGILDGMKSALGIKSPSVEAEKQVGVFIPQGVARGITKASHFVDSSIKRMSKGVLGTYSNEMKPIISITDKMWKGNIERWKSGTTKVEEEEKAHTKRMQELIDKKNKAISEANSKYAKNNKKRQEAIRKANDKFREEESKENAKHAESIKKANESTLNDERKFREGMTKINEDYQKKVRDLNNKFKEEENKLNEEYNKILNDRTKSLMGWTDLFSEVQGMDKTVDTSKLTSNLEDQVNVFENWVKNMESLKAKVGTALYDELYDKGPSAFKEIEAINNMSFAQLERYEELYERKRQIAEEQARQDTKEDRERIDKEIENLKVTYKEKFEELSVQMSEAVKKQLDTVKDKFGKVPPALLETGRNSIDQFIKGIESMESALYSKVESIVSSVQERLGISIATPSLPVRKAMEKTSLMTDALRPMVGSKPDASTFRSTSNSRRSVNRKDDSEKKDIGKIEINNTYNSPKPASVKELKEQDEIQMRRMAMQYF